MDFRNFLAEIEELRRAGADFYSDDEIINFQRYMHHKFTDNVNADREYWIPAKFHCFCGVSATHY